MGHKPGWRLPFKKAGNRHPVQSLAFKAARVHNLDADSPTPKCQGTARSTGQKCKKVALRGGKFCKMHHGLIGAAKAEEERYGRPVIIKRLPRKTALGGLGATAPLPAGMPLWMDKLGPYQRGRAIEAWENRLTAPDVWANELVMPRYRGKPR
jgi:hypothetical protein